MLSNQSAGTVGSNMAGSNPSSVLGVDLFTNLRTDADAFRHLSWQYLCREFSVRTWNVALHCSLAHSREIFFLTPWPPR